MPESDNIYIRLVQKQDAMRIYLWELDRETQLVTDSDHKVSLEMIYNLIDGQNKINDSRQLRMMVCLDSNNEAIGMVDLHNIDFIKANASLGILIAEKTMRNKGFAGSAILKLHEYARSELGLTKINAVVQDGNTASISLFQSLAYRKLDNKPLNSAEISFEFIL